MVFSFRSSTSKLSRKTRISQLDIHKRKINPVSKTTTLVSRLPDTNQEHAKDYISQMMTLDRLAMHVLLVTSYPMKHFKLTYISKRLSILIFTLLIFL